MPNKKNNFTYLIGAGASAQAIPVIANFSSKLREFAAFLKKVIIKEDRYISATGTLYKPTKIKEELISDIDWLASECDKHASIDTFARKLFLAGRYDELLKLKGIVSEFLLYQQMLNGVDPRYDAFFATLLEKKNDIELKLPENIKIVSWNYDKQVELSVSQFLKNQDSLYIDNFLNLIPRTGEFKVSNDCFSLIKLNGSVGGEIDENGFKSLQIDYDDKLTKQDPDEMLVKNLLLRYHYVQKQIIIPKHQFKRTNFPTIQYSWENNPVLQKVRDSVMEATRLTNYLVVIGYSFPTFNRNLDKDILRNMEPLEKVFIQSPPESIKGVEQRFKALYGDYVEIETLTNVDEFFIPFEF